MADKKFIEEVLKSHNEYRAQHQASKLTHNKDLSATAQKWADHLALTNTFQHSSASYKGEALGENIAMKWSSGSDAYNGQEVSDQWYSEVQQHTFGTEPRSLGSGHFTQIVWKGSKELGVGKAQTKDGKIIVVANYRPAGNMMGEFAKQVLPPKDGKIVIKEKPAAQSQVRVGGQDNSDDFKSRFDDMRKDFFKDRGVPSQSSRGAAGSSSGESKSVRTYTVTEGSGANKVTKTITEETIIKSNGEKIVNRKETTSSGDGGSSTLADDFGDQCRVNRSPFQDKKSKSHGHRSKSSSSSDSSPERKSSKSKKPEKMSDFIDGVLKAHNSARKKHGVSKLKHSKDLSAHAQHWAEHLASSGAFQHSKCELEEDRIGENIACKWSSGAGGDYTGQEVSDQWYSELAKHDFNSDRSTGSGHFTQMVWKGSKELGVGKARDQSGKVIVVANYRPAGNMIGQYRENVFPLK